MRIQGPALAFLRGTNAGQGFKLTNCRGISDVQNLLLVCILEAVVREDYKAVVENEGIEARMRVRAGMLRTGVLRIVDFFYGRTIAVLDFMEF